MLRLIGIPLTCLAMFSIAGAQWGILQTVAWVGMLQNYSRQAPLTEAISKTFDGNHPCSLCLKIAKDKREQEKMPLALKAEKKASDFIANAAAALAPPPLKDFVFPERLFLFSERHSAPPVPIPIVGLA